MAELATSSVTTPTPPVHLTDLDRALEVEKNNNRKETWRKLDKTTKLSKLRSFAERYIADHELLTGDGEHLMFFFRDCLSRAKLQHVKDVVYNTDTGEITSIPSLVHNRSTNHFTLKNGEYVSALKSLPAPRKRSATPRKPPSTANPTTSALTTTVATAEK